MIFKGIIHVHSNFSYDGQHSLDEIAEFAVKRRYSFVGMSEHSDTLSEETLAFYVKECKAVSSPECLVIPGIEFTCENDLHVLGFGVQHYTRSKDPVQVAEFIKENGGVAVIAHPKRYNYQIPIDLARAVNGIEVWNAGYDRRFVPNEYSLKLLRGFRRHNRSLLAFGGQDLHQIADHCHVQIAVSSEELEEGSILEALRGGNFAVSNHYFQLDARREIGWFELAYIRFGRQMCNLAKSIRDRLEAWAG